MHCVHQGTNKYASASPVGTSVLQFLPMWQCRAATREAATGRNDTGGLPTQSAPAVRALLHTRLLQCAQVKPQCTPMCSSSMYSTSPVCPPVCTIVLLQYPPMCTIVVLECPQCAQSKLATGRNHTERLPSACQPGHREFFTLFCFNVETLF